MIIHRKGNYEIGFKYFKNNTEITDDKDIEFIKSLKIPPAYDNVSIINNKKIIAYGYDKKGRKQVKYNPSYTAQRNKNKFDKILKSLEIFSKIRKNVIKDMKRVIDNNDKKRTIAIIIYLIICCGFRIGNEKYERENNSYGITTLKLHHIELKNNIITIDFIGKKGVRNVSSCKNKLIYEYLKEKKELSKKDDNVFTYTEGDVKKNITSKDVNEYLKSFDEEIQITSKDLRTWNANYLFVKHFNIHKKNCEKNPIKRAIEDVATSLHNSVSICKKNYINPDIITYAEGLLEKK